MNGTESILIAAAKNLAGLVIKTSWGGVVRRNIPTAIEQQIYKATEQYIRRYSERHGTMKVLGMSKPVSLESIYTEVQCLDAQELRNFETIEALETSYRQTGRRGLTRERGERQSGIHIARNEKCLTVLGGPGTGKSTFLRRTGLEALKGKAGEFQHSCIPIFLELKRYDNDEIDIESLITEEFRICGFPNPQPFVNQALKRGRLLILLDGLDEVPTQNLTQVIRKIQDFID